MNAGWSKRTRRLSEAGSYTWWRILCHRRYALIWVRWDK